MKLRIPYLLATVVAVASCLYLADTRSLKAAPLTYVETIAGHEIDLTAPAGKTRLITFWSPDCPISERNVAALKELHKQFSDDEFEIVAVAMPYSELSEIHSYIKKHDISYPVAFDRSGEMSDAFPGVRFTPTTFLIDSDSNIVWKHIGRMTADEAIIEITPTLQLQQHLAKH